MKPFLIFLMSLSALAYAEGPHKKMAIVYGGNDGTAPFSRNIFSERMVQASTALNDNGWNTVVGFSHDTSTFVERVPPSISVRTAKKADLIALLDKAVSDLKEGDQLYLMVNTHGDPNEFVASGEGVSYSDPDIIARLKKLRDKGVKMGFTVESCYGGSSVKPWSEYGCAVSATTADSVSAGAPLSDVLIKSLKDPSKTLSLSDLYLDALGDPSTVTLPEITGFDSGNQISEITATLQKNTAFFAAHSDYFVVSEGCYGSKADEILDSKMRALGDSLVREADHTQVCELFGDRCVKSAELSTFLRQRIEAFKKSNTVYDASALVEQNLQKQCLAVDPKDSFGAKIDMTFLELFPKAEKNWKTPAIIWSALSSGFENNVSLLRAGTEDDFRISLHTNPCELAMQTPEKLNAEVDQILSVMIKNGLVKAGDSDSLKPKLSQLIQTSLQKAVDGLSPGDHAMYEKAKPIVTQLLAVNRDIATQQKQINMLFESNLNSSINQSKAYLYLDHLRTTTDKRCQDFKFK